MEWNVIYYLLKVEMRIYIGITAKSHVWKGFISCHILSTKENSVWESKRRDLATTVTQSFSCFLSLFE